MPLIEIVCPYHRAKEQLDLPASYGPSFDGELPCGDRDYQALLRVKIANSKVIHVSVSPREDEDDDDPGEPPPDFWDPPHEVSSYPSGYGPSEPFSPQNAANFFEDMKDREAKRKRMKAETDLLNEWKERMHREGR